MTSCMTKSEFCGTVGEIRFKILQQAKIIRPQAASEVITVGGAARSRFMQFTSSHMTHIHVGSNKGQGQFEVLT